MFPFKILPNILLCLVLITAGAWADGFTKGREIAPLTPKFKPGDYVWKPEVSPAGPVVIIVSIPVQEMFVYRNGVQIGRTTFVLDPKQHGMRGTHVYSALARVDAQGRRDWLATTSIGGGKAPDVKALAALTKIPSGILAKVRPIMGIAPEARSFIFQLSQSQLIS
jgi:hypothetical protein